MSLLLEWECDRPLPQWRHWVVGMEPTGRITLPFGAWKAIGSEAHTLAASRGGMLVLHHGGLGVSLAVDRRGVSFCRPGFAAPLGSQVQYLFAARALVTPAVVLVPTDILETSCPTLS